jgi:hypothetical protein
VAITNEINAFLPESRRASKISFCVKIAQRRAFYRSCWSPNEKIIGQVHFVYQLHPRGKRFRQIARRD